MIGKRVRIKKWKDMAKEFGLDELGFIKCKGTFTEGMKELCGEEFVVTYIDKQALKGHRFGYCITEDMVTIVEETMYFTNNTVVVAMQGNKVGIAKCCPTDVFNLEFGKALAKARLEEDTTEEKFLLTGRVEGKTYYCINSYGRILERIEYYSVVDDNLASAGNYFTTEEKALASDLYKTFAKLKRM